MKSSSVQMKKLQMFSHIWYMYISVYDCVARTSVISSFVLKKASWPKRLQIKLKKHTQKTLFYTYNN